MTKSLNSRDRVIKLFKREPIDYIPVFSGYGNITIHGLEENNWNFSEIHTDAEKMAHVAASTFKMFGFECAVVPFDVGVEAEALGSKVNYYSHRTDIVYPTISEPVAQKVVDLEIKAPADLANAGRIPVVTKAIEILKREIGQQVAIGSWVLGPYTLAGQLVDLSDLSKSAFKRMDLVGEVLEKLADILIAIIQIYKQAGADYITVREMGAGSDVLSPRIFQQLVRPPLERLFSAIESPSVLHMCGDTDNIVEQMASCGADAISVERKNHVEESRRKLGPDALIFGDLDAYNVLVKGTPADVDSAVKDAIERGVNAVWPGCDIWPLAPKENMRAMVDAARKYGKIN